MSDLPVPPPPPDASPSGMVKHPANFGLRLVAHLIDAVILFLITRISFDLVSIVSFTLASIAGVVVLFWYWAEFEGARGQTLGKKAVKIRTVGRGTLEPIGWWLALGRFVGKFISGFVFLIGYLWMLWDDDQQTWHDKMVNSEVVMA